MRRRSVMEPRFIWLLEEMCRNSGVDVQLIDLQLSYSENKAEIQKITGVKLRLATKHNMNPMDFCMLPYEVMQVDEETVRAQEEMYNDFVGIKKGRKKDKKIPVDIGNIIRVAKGEE